MMEWSLNSLDLDFTMTLNLRWFLMVWTQRWRFLRLETNCCSSWKEKRTELLIENVLMVIIISYQPFHRNHFIWNFSFSCSSFNLFLHSFHQNFLLNYHSYHLNLHNDIFLTMEDNNSSYSFILWLSWFFSVLFQEDSEYFPSGVDIVLT